MRMYHSAKRLLSFVLLLTTLFFFNACQKIDSLKPEVQEELIADNVESWLNTQIAIRKPENATVVRNMKENLLLAKISYEKLNDKERLIIIPISEKFVSKNNSAKPVTNYLLLVMDEKNKFKSGNIVQYIPEDKSEKADVPKNGFRNILNGIPVLGQFTFLSVSDLYRYEKEYRKDKSYRTSIKSPKEGVIKTDANCIDWYLITYWTNPDGSTYTTEEYIGRTCDGCGGTDECLDPGESGTITSCEIPDLQAGTTVESVTLDTHVGDINGFTKSKNPEWKILSNLTWRLYSHENGVIELVDIPNNKWQWKSLTHHSITYHGYSLGGTISHSQGVGTPSFTPGAQNVLYAGMSLNYSVTFAPICNCPGVNIIVPPATVSYNSTAMWDANPF